MHLLDSLPLTDRGLHYGDGLFETMAVVDGHVRLLERHLARLHHGADRLGLPLPDMGELRAMLEQAAREHAEGVLKLIVTRGSGGRGYLPPEEGEPSVILLRYPPVDAESLQAPVVARLCELRLSRQPRLAGIKHLNRLEYVLARAEWRDPAIGEGLLMDEQGWLVEGVVSNLFIVREGRLLTPALDQCGVAGVMRAQVIEHARCAGFEVEERLLGMHDLLGADEAFLTNSLTGIRPLVELRGHRDWPAGDVTTRLQRGLWEQA